MVLYLPDGDDMLFQTYTKPIIKLITGGCVDSKIYLTGNFGCESKEGAGIFFIYYRLSQVIKELFDVVKRRWIYHYRWKYIDR